MESSDSVASVVFDAFVEQFGEDVDLTEAEVQEVVDGLANMGVDARQYRECVALKVWGETQPSTVFPPELRESLLFPHLTEEDKEFHRSHYSEGSQRYLRDVKQTVLPPEVELAVDEAVEDGIVGFDGVALTDYALVDVLFTVQTHLYDLLPANSPFEVSACDDGAVEVLFDDRSCVYYTVELPWAMEQMLDERMSALSVGAALEVMERAALLRAQETFDSESFEEEIQREGTAVVMAISPDTLPPVDGLP